MSALPGHGCPTPPDMGVRGRALFYKLESSCFTISMMSPNPAFLLQASERSTDMSSTDGAVRPERREARMDRSCRTMVRRERHRDELLYFREVVRSSHCSLISKDIHSISSMRRLQCPSRPRSDWRIRKESLTSIAFWPVQRDGFESPRSISLTRHRGSDEARM